MTQPAAAALDVDRYRQLQAAIAKRKPAVEVVFDADHQGQPYVLRTRSRTAIDRKTNKRTHEVIRRFGSMADVAAYFRV